MIQASRIFGINSDEAFRAMALEIAQFQQRNNAVHRQFCSLMRTDTITVFEEIPFLPIRFFKAFDIVSEAIPTEPLVFLSSGTGAQGRSKHVVTQPAVYEQSYSLGFEHYFGEPKEWVILALLPNYVAQGHSSLVYMVEGLIQQTNHPASGFLLDAMYTYLS